MLCWVDHHAIRHDDHLRVLVVEAFERKEAVATKTTLFGRSHKCALKKSALAVLMVLVAEFLWAADDIDVGSCSYRIAHGCSARRDGVGVGVGVGAGLISVGVGAGAGAGHFALAFGFVRR